MLVLGRRVGEKIIIGDDIEIIVSSIERGQVKLGIIAPENIRVHREEIYNRIKENNNERN